ncbi:MAG: hypothetical protein GTO18_18020 [Anaerolineales bacterium]|nr:hypothetical protein [Anaerolineales bacterium]
MNSKNWISLASLCVLFLVACGPRTTPPAPDITAGVYIGVGYEFFHWEEGLAVMIWHDAAQSSSCDSSGSTSSPTHVVRCHAISKAGIRFDWHLETDDGKTAVFTINEAAYDLTNGALFIVTTASGVTEVSQLERDLSNVQPNNESVVEFSLSDHDVNEFIQSTSSK